MNPIGHSPKNKQKKRSNISTTTSDSNCVDFAGMKSDIGTTSITRTKKKKNNKRRRDDNNNDETNNNEKKNNEQMTRHSKKRRHEQEHKIMSSQTNNNHSPGIHDDTNHNNHRHCKKRKKNKSSSSSDKLLKGLVLSISTDSLRNNSNQNTTRTNTSTTTPTCINNNDLLTYKQACAMAQELGATISAQVHSKVHAVLCHVPTSYDSSSHRDLSVVTQRMKKALKKSIPIWDLQWLVEIYKYRQWMDPKSFIVTPTVQELWSQQEQQQLQQQRQQELQKQDQNGKNCGPTEVDVEYESEEELLNTVEKGWSEPISLDCCCVCHDDDRDDCPWCCQGDTKCNVFLKKKEQEKKVGSA